MSGGASDEMPGRKPYRNVLRTLRQEVGFCCPVEGCGNPYLTWHHFDPPWRVEKHHRPEGMIALCREHADKADNGSFTDEQLRELKRLGRDRATEVRGRFDWMRRDLLAVVGGNFYYNARSIIEIGSEPCVWFERDEDGYLLLNVRLPSLSKRPRARIENNFWSVKPTVAEVISPPNGRRLEINYANGDRFKAEFFIVQDAARLVSRYQGFYVERWADRLNYPLTVVELYETTAGTQFDVGPHGTTIGSASMVGNFMHDFQGTAIRVTVPDEVASQLFDEGDFSELGGEALA